MIEPEHQCHCLDHCFLLKINNIKIGNPDVDKNTIKRYQEQNQKLLEQNKELLDKNSTLSELLTRPDNKCLFPKSSMFTNHPISNTNTSQQFNISYSNSMYQQFKLNHQF